MGRLYDYPHSNRSENQEIVYLQDMVFSSHLMGYFKMINELSSYIIVLWIKLSLYFFNSDY